MYGVVNRRPYGVALETRLGQAYNEEAFRYFLTIERKRAARAQRPVLLLLLHLRQVPEPGLEIDQPLAAKLFSSLWVCLRESDIVGWFSEGRVIGAVLTPVEDRLEHNATSLIRERVASLLADGLSLDVARRVRVRVYQLRSDVKG
jgi:hypothetical protein